MAQTHVIESFYKDYLTLRHGGLSHEQALQHFDFMHAISLAQLKKRIKQGTESEYVTLVDAEARRAESALEVTQPLVKKLA